MSFVFESILGASGWRASCPGAVRTTVVSDITERTQALLQTCRIANDSSQIRCEVGLNRAGEHVQPGLADIEDHSRHVALSVKPACSRIQKLALLQPIRSSARAIDGEIPALPFSSRAFSCSSSQSRRTSATSNSP